MPAAEDSGKSETACLAQCALAHRCGNMAVFFTCSLHRCVCGWVGGDLEKSKTLEG